MSESLASETVRKAATIAINAEEGSREYLEQKHGQVWDTRELQKDFDAEGFCAPCVIVIRKTDGVRGSLFFQHSPRFYFDFSPA